MTLLPRVEDARERMDEPDVDRAMLEAALDQVAAVNRWLGARRALLRHLAWGLPPSGGRVVDVGTGSADLARAVGEWARGRACPIAITAIDRHATTVDVARRRTAGSADVRMVRADGLQLPFPAGIFQLGLLSMTLHHMDGPVLVDILRELRRVCRGGRILVGELERNLLHYLGARALAATVWRHNAVTRHDGPLSVRRAFTPGELTDLARRADLTDAVVHRHPVFRLILRARA